MSLRLDARLLGTRAARLLRVVVLSMYVVGSAVPVMQGMAGAASLSSTAAATGQVTKPAMSITDATALTGQAVKFADSAPIGDGFNHPGILLATSQLDFVKAKIAAKADPWYSAYNDMRNRGTGTGGKFSSLSYTPGPVADVKCVGANGDKTLAVGCQQQIDDSIAAYSDALIWYYTGDTAYADKAISIMNAWSAQLTNIEQGSPYIGGVLNASWSGQTITRAAEIIRYTSTRWSDADVRQFEDMLNNVYLPKTATPWNGGGANWLTSQADATMDIGVFTNNRATFNQGVTEWKGMLPSIIYMKSDVNPYPQLAGYPIPPKNTMYDKSTTTVSKIDTYWNTPGQYEDGLEGETCRDMTHTAFGLDGMMMGAETARLQGVDLYAGNTDRMVAGYEFNAHYFAQQLGSGSVPSWLCGGTISTGGQGYQLGWEVGYNALHDRLGIDMPYTKAFMDTYTRPAIYNTGLFMNWEQMTSGDSANVCAAPDRSLGTTTFAINVANPGTYKLWTRIKAASATDTSFALQVDGNCAYNGGGGPAVPDQWSWVNYQNGDPTSSISTNLTAGNHLITIVGKSPNLTVDSVLIADDPTCVPKDEGSDCNADTTSPSSPTNLRANNITSGGVDLSWDAASDDKGVDHYVLRREGMVIATTTAITFSDSGLSAGRAYGYTVTAVDAAGNVSKGSQQLDVLTLFLSDSDTEAPGMPDNVTVALAGTTASLQWSPSTDNVGVDHYIISRNGTAVGQTSDPTFTDATLDQNTRYTYTVKAVDAAGNQSAESTPQSVTTADSLAPTVPTNLSVTSVVSNSVSLQWTPSTDNVAVDHYVISRGGTVIGESSAANFTDATVASADSYTYTVKAVDAAGNSSAPSTPVIATMPDTTAPTAPTNLTTTTITTSSVGLSWTAATDNIGVTGYEIYRGGYKVGTTQYSNYTDSGLSSNTAYSYSVLAVDAAGNRSALSANVNARTAVPPDTTAPSAPGTFTAKASALGQVTLNWSAATDNVGVTGYKLSRGGTVIASTPGTTLSYVDSNLSANTGYTYAISAVDAAGNASSAKSATITTPLDAAPRGAGFAGAYFNNTTLSGPAVGRLDPTINFAWGSNAPVAGINTTNYSARWTGMLTPTKTGSYTFYTQTDDGVRLYLNDTLLVDHWTAGGGSYSKTVSLTAGAHYNLRMEYYQAAGTANAVLQWSGPGIAKAVLPSSVMNSGSAGLSASYFTNNSLSSATAVQRLDNTINFAWGTAAPDPRIPADNFSARWVGKITTPITGNYTFYTDSDDGIRVWVNGVQVINNWTAHTLTTNTSSKISLAAGTTYSIKVEYYEHTSSATAKLYWSYGSVAKTVIPTTALRDR